jgi:hypothetical protein
MLMLALMLLPASVFTTLSVVANHTPWATHTTYEGPRGITGACSRFEKTLKNH